MDNINELPVIGIIGCGPRGLSALESLFTEAAKNRLPVKALVFEKSKFPGSGPVYNTQQPDSNWLNVSERAIDIPPRNEIVFENFKVPAFPDFQEWCGYISAKVEDIAVDRFPTRSKLGRYLFERYKSISSVLFEMELIEYVNTEVTQVDFDTGAVHIDVLGGSSYRAKEAVMCIGHQPIDLDDQMSGWQSRVSNLDTVKLYTQPYPLRRISESTGVKNSSIAVRGFGLAMIDVLRSLTEERGGTFEIKDEKTREMVYSQSGREPKEIIPFSLNGLPMAPKPLNKRIDSWYVPTEAELKAYSSSVRKAMDSGSTLTSPKFLIEAITPIILNKFLRLGDKAAEHSLTEQELTSAIGSWLRSGDFEHTLIISKNSSSEKVLRKFIGMATGHNRVSLDFCIGHVWRHCQPTMYKLLSFASISDELVSEIVGLDERLKRYSYGPPVDSLQQILALIKSGNVTLDLVNDPDIDLTEAGWKMEKNETSKIADMMINSVLDAPQILKVTSTLPKNLIRQSEAEPLCDVLGIRTEKDATLDRKGKETEVPFSVLGRLAKGTLIGVDAIAECFSDRSQYWAKGVLSRCSN